MGAKATAKNVRVSARKVRFVIDMIRGKKADVEMAQLSILKNRAARAARFLRMLSCAISTSAFFPRIMSITNRTLRAETLTFLAVALAPISVYPFYRIFRRVHGKFGWERTPQVCNPPYLR